MSDDKPVTNIKKLKNLSKSFQKNAAEFKKNKRLLADKELIDKRLKICKGCPFKNPKNNTCKKCGCFIGLKVKLKVEECPIYKW